MSSLRSLVVSAFLLTSCLAHADGMQSEMDSMFGTMTNITDPQLTMGTRRGSISGGAYSMRSGVKSFNALTIEPPSFQAGCGGIDAYFGSMSWASKDQVIQMMRAIASNAAGYAFSLALAQACPDCDAQIKDFAAQMTSWTGELKDSCTAAKALMGDKGKTAAEESGKWIGTFLGTTSGDQTDTFEANSGTQNGQTPADKAAADDPAGFTKEVEMNVVWAALKKQPIAAWWTGGGHVLREEIMSISGSMVSCHLAISPGCGQSGSTPPTDTNGMVTYTLQPTIQLSDLVFGGKDGMGSRYKCDDEATCYGPHDEGFPLKGFAGMVEDMFFGADGNGGIIAAMASPTGGLTLQQESFLATAGPIGAAVVRTAKTDIGAAHHLASALGTKIALDMGYTFANNAVRTAEASTSQMYGAISGPAAEALRARKIELGDQFRKIDDELKANMWALDYAMAVISFLPAMPTPGALPTRGY